MEVVITCLRRGGSSSNFFFIFPTFFLHFNAEFLFVFLFFVFLHKSYQVLNVRSIFKLKSFCSQNKTLD